MKIAALLCNYNGADYLYEALESIFNQTRPADYILLVDDCSTDQSMEILRSFQEREPRPMILSAASNGGQGAAMSLGIYRIPEDTDVVSFIDHDDLWDPGKLQFVEDQFHRYPDAALVQHNLRLLKGTTPSSELFRSFCESGDLLARLRHHGEWTYFFPTVGLSFRRDVLMKIIPIPAVMRISADGFLTRTAMCFGPVISTILPYGYYRVHQTNSTFKNSSYSEFHNREMNLKPSLNHFYEKHGIDYRYPPPASPLWHRIRKRIPQPIRKMMKKIRP